MNKTTHTPGPWTVTGNYIARRGEAIGVTVHPFTHVQWSTERNGDEAKANAVLMANAPELLAMVETLADHLDARDAAHYHGSSPIVQAARAAIAKARGEA